MATGETVKATKTVETHQERMLIWSKAAARVAAEQRKNGEIDMKRIILAALVGVLVSGPVWGCDK